MPVTVKQGDKYEIPFTAASADGPFDLTGSTVVLVARPYGTTGDGTDLEVTSRDDEAGQVSTDAWDALDAGDWDVELQVTTGDGQIITFPTDEQGRPQYERLTITPRIPAPTP